MNRDNKMMRFKKLCIGTADMLLPNPDVDLQKWATVASDQMDEKYWTTVKENVGDAPCTVNMVYPKCEIAKDDEQVQKEKIKSIRDTTLNYFENLYKEVTEKQSDGFVFVKRETSAGTRKGIMMCVDLKHTGIDKLYRPSQEVDEKELQIAMDIRKDATVEVPHIIMLADDKDNLLFEKENEYNEIKLYDIDLMENGSKVSGYELKGEKVYYVSDAFEKIFNNECTLICANGNTELMAAKTYYDNLEKDFGELFLRDHPLRYTLVEVVNIHDDAVEILPLHKVIKGASKDQILKSIDGAKVYDNMDGQIKVYGKDFEFSFDFGDDYLVKADKAFANSQIVPCPDKAIEMAKDGDIAIIMPKIDKSIIFEYVKTKGAMPQNSFTVGKAFDKRYYVEVRRIMM